MTPLDTIGKRWKSKDGAFTHFKNYEAKAQYQLYPNIKWLRSDRGGEYFSNKLDYVCPDNGIIHDKIWLTPC
jgi:transposase InsO family protein